MLGNTHAQIDKDGDGQISYIEFKDLVRMLENERGGLRPKVYHTYNCVMAHVKVSHTTRMNKSCNSYECVMPHVNNS